MAQSAPNLDAPLIMATLEQCDVQYLVIGGMAGLFFGAQRPTEDLDLVIRRERANLRNLAEALKQLNARIRVAHIVMRRQDYYRFQLTSCFSSRISQQPSELTLAPSTFSPACNLSGALSPPTTN
jgi:hypothetical protein